MNEHEYEEKMREFRSAQWRGFFMICLVIFILIAVAILVPYGVKQGAQKNLSACGTNLRMIELRKHQFVERHPVGSIRQDGDHTVVVIPRCPAGGTYDIGNFTNRASCSIHGQLQ